jgi:nitrogen fixation protein FixH
MSPTKKWVLAIVGLLGGNVIAMIILATTAATQSSQIIPDYYAHAAAYDDSIDQAARSRALGWTADASLSSATIDVSVRDAAGAPLAGARVHVGGYQRAHAAQRFELDLTDLGGGRYRAATTAEPAGVHDLTIVVDRGAEHYSRMVTVETR